MGRGQRAAGGEGVDNSVIQFACQRRHLSRTRLRTADVLSDEVMKVGRGRREAGRQGREGEGEQRGTAVKAVDFRIERASAQYPADWQDL